MNTIAACELEKLINCASDSLLVIDCRSFLTYNKGHIRNAVNIMRSNSIMRRRSRGVVTLESTIINSEKREAFLSGRTSVVAVYDEQGDLTGDDINSATLKKTALIAIKALRTSAPSDTVNILYLAGGFQSFQSQFPQSCEGSMRMCLTETGASDETKMTPCTPTPVYDQGSPVQILPHLYLGSAYHASQKKELKELGITALVNASSSCENLYESEFRYKRIPVEDTGVADISSWFDDVIAFINGEKSRGGKTFVHCHAGVSRSATLCLAYLMTRYHISLNAAFRYVKSRRSVISPNFNFMGQLLTLENSVGASSNGLFDQQAVERMEVIAELEAEKENVAHSPLTEELFPNKTEPLSALSASKLYRRRAVTVMPLSIPTYNNYSLRGDKRCMTAPAISPDKGFAFNEPKRYCNQQTGFRLICNRHPRTLTLSS